MDIGNINEEALIGRARNLTKKIQVVAQTCWTSSQEWHSLRRPRTDVNYPDSLTAVINEIVVTTTK